MCNTYVHIFQIVAIIGLRTVASEAREGENVTVFVEVQYGELARNVTVHLSTHDGTATGK